ncbi:knob-associated histidine-rich protein, putative [Plasmodium malariae]|uniref:Knob-associated histidine-rich protein, putative n=1 Tax=Plasmodium malariae TaxID=5858 RepID=A0A1A8X256_PLAMA|nr:knob-associated histidine-rich protein, putative [Plasmodium malariae]SBS99329.1 knob-associated histidine-rich protein, putative (KAHRP) [Plasmodium malariae]SBT87210.1 knob-associated histidine-rich protein, putative [Plasmodium malariae]
MAFSKENNSKGQKKSFLKTAVFSLLFLWMAHCSNNVEGTMKDSRVQRSLAVAKPNKKKNPLMKTRVVKEITHGGFKEYEEKYESKHYKLKENVESGNKNCDEKYEAANYGFREKCPYEVDPYGGAAGPDIFLLRKRFPFGPDNQYEDDEDDLFEPESSEGYPRILRHYVEEDDSRGKNINSPYPENFSSFKGSNKKCSSAGTVKGESDGTPTGKGKKVIKRNATNPVAPGKGKKDTENYDKILDDVDTNKNGKKEKAKPCCNTKTKSKKN